MRIELSTLEATLHVGRALGAKLFAGAVVALVGPLGAGKTHLVRAVAEGLETPNSQIVNSPTFVLVQEYEGRLPIFHFDAYRLKSAAEFDDLGMQDYYDAKGVCLIEWADRVLGALPSHYLRLDLNVTSETSRCLDIQPIGPEYESLVRELQEDGFGTE